MEAKRSRQTLRRLRRRWQAWAARGVAELIATITELQPGRRVVPEAMVDEEGWLARTVTWCRRWEAATATPHQPSAGIFASVNLAFGERLGWL